MIYPKIKARFRAPLMSGLCNYRCDVCGEIATTKLQVQFDLNQSAIEEYCVCDTHLELAESDLMEFIEKAD